MLFLSGGTTLKGFGKAAGIPAATFASGGNMNTGRYGLGGAGIQTAALAFAGAEPSTSAKTEEYNGSSWTETGDLNTARYLASKSSAGTSYTAALCISGASPPVANVESWNGSTWTEIADVNTGRRGGGAGGTQTSSLLFGGAEPSISAKTESWNGSSWTEVSDLNEGREDTGGGGASNTSAICAGGGDPSRSANVEVWDGSSWTEVSNLNAATYESPALTGIASQALSMGGNVSGTNPGTAGKVEAWDGTSWTEINEMASARSRSGSSSTSATTALLFGGAHPSPTVFSATEEFTADNTLSTVTVS
jgi:hypothetical protein